MLVGEEHQHGPTQQNTSEGFKEGTSTGNDYIYDANGNMTIDKNKDIYSSPSRGGQGDGIIYNHLNLPAKVSKSNGDYINYTYDASGRKLKQEVYKAGQPTPEKVTDYAGEYIYENTVLQFINHEEGRVVVTPLSSGEGQGVRYEYQYHLKDHLGNVRLTFTTVVATDQHTATYEEANKPTEQSQYVRYSTAKRVNSMIFDRTNGAATGYAERLNGSENEKYGIAKSISVMPGDVINAEVYAKYADPTSSNWNTALTTLMTQIATNTGGIVIDGSNIASSTTSFPGYGSLQTKSDNGAPKAYLNWLVFDHDFNFLPAGSGYKQITTAGKETGTDVTHEQLASPTITITQPGYVYIYLSNESASVVEVYFDDFKVTHTKSPVIASNDYYPFGLTFNSYSRENSVAQDYKYNSKELQDELGLGWLDYGARMYMPEIGRWNSTDPLAEKYYPLSPYSYVANCPINSIDPNGEEIMIIGDGDYILATLNAILQIGRTKKGAKMIDRLASSNNRVVISNGDKNGQKAGEDQNGNLTSYVDWNPLIKESEGKERPSFIGLSHELRHSDQTLAGFISEEIINSKAPFAEPPGATIFTKEIDAFHFENEVRKANGIDLRLTKEGMDTGIGKGKKTFGTGFNTITGKYTVPNTKSYAGERNYNYAIFWARFTNSMKRGGPNLSEYSMSNPQRNDKIDNRFDFRKENNAAIIKY